MNRLLRLCAIAAITAPSGVLGAQVVWPAAYATTPGNAVLNSPFTVRPGHPTATTRMMVVIDPSSLPFPVGTTLTRISLRRDVGHASQAYAGLSGNLTVRVGRVLAQPAEVRDVRFARLWDGPPTLVYRNVAPALFTAPGAAPTGTSAPPFNVVIQFTVDHVWQGGPLGVELLFSPASGTSEFRIDAFRRPSPANGTSHLVGTGCGGSNGFVPAHHVLPETARPGAVLTTQVDGIRSGQAIAFHMLGSQNTTWLGLPLPFGLGVFGAPPTCFLRIDPVVISTVPVGNPSALFARATSSAAVPAVSAAVGAELYSQWLLFDSGLATPLQVSVSDAQRITLGPIAPAPATTFARTIWKYGATGYDDDSGRMVLDDYGPVLRFN